MLRPFNPLSPPSAAPRTQRAWARWCLWWLCVAQICLPLLGKLHDLAHVPMATPVAQLVADVQKADAALNSDDPLSQRWQDLFGKHSAAECQWFGHLALGMGLFTVLCIWGAKELDSQLGWPLWAISIGIFVLAWIAQFIGHGVEGKKPSFLKDLQFLLIGPAWLLSKAYRNLRIPY